MTIKRVFVSTLQIVGILIMFGVLTPIALLVRGVAGVIVPLLLWADNMAYEFLLGIIEGCKRVHEWVVR